MLLFAALAGGVALAQSQAERTGQGGAMVAAGAEGGSLLTHPLTIGTVIGSIIAAMLVVATEDNSPVQTTTTATTTR
jgi:hypothetical protein